MSCSGKAPSPVSLLFLGRKQLPLTKEEQFSVRGGCSLKHKPSTSKPLQGFRTAEIMPVCQNEEGADGLEFIST